MTIKTVSILIVVVLLPLLDITSLYAAKENFAQTTTTSAMFSVKQTIYQLGDRRGRRDTFRELKNMGTAATDALIEVLGESDAKTSVKISCIQLLREIKSEKALDLLIQTSRESPVRLRLESIRAIGVIGGDITKKPLLLAISDPTYQVRIAAIEGLTAFNDPEVTEAIIGRIMDDDEDVVLTAIRVLGEAKSAEAIEPLLKKLQSTRPAVVRAVIEALSEFKSPTAVEPLIGLLKHGDKSIRFRAVNALALHGDARAVPHLVEHLDDEITRIKAAAYTALKTITGKDFGYDKGAWTRNA